MMQRVSGDAERKRGAILHVAGAHGQYLAAADAVVGTQAQPGSKRCGAAKLGQIGADFGQQGMNQQSVDTGNLGEVHTEYAIVLGAKVVVGVAGIHLRGRDFLGARQRFLFRVDFGSKLDKVPLYFIVALCDELAVVPPCVEALTQGEEMFGTVISY